ncbi:hypothetical protein F5Y01DRAFT_317734 [Xylaria sp. FL0043]|nr:hypothetical protein F5Y01DRAFT_317734 [Xylaria sp. FL0043]
MGPTETENSAAGESCPALNTEEPVRDLAKNIVLHIHNATSRAERAAPAETTLAASTSTPVTAVASGAINEDVEGLQKDVKSGPSSGKATKSITLRHHRGEGFVLPLALCQTRKEIEDLIKLSYEDDEKAQKEIDEGKYELTSTNGAIILPCFWERLVEPGLEVTIRLKSQQRWEDVSEYDTDNSDASHNIKDQLEEQAAVSGTSYTTKLKYTVATYVKGHQTLVFLHGQSYDEPVTLDDKTRNLPILEEVQVVLVPQSRVWGKEKTKAPKGKPKLRLGDMIGKKSLRIHSPLLLNALKSIIKYSSKAPSGEETYNFIDGEFPHPYADLFYHKQELSDYRKQVTGPRANHTPEYNAECDRHIEFLLEYLEQEPNVRIRALETMWAKKIPTTTFAGLWLLMKPGSDVYVQEDGQLNAYVVDWVSGGVDYLSPSQWSASVQGYNIRVWYLRYDGKVIERGSKTIHVSVFYNEREILSLPIFPTRFQDNKDGGARRRQLIERGRKVFRLSKGPTYLEYTGFGLKPGWKQYNQARVVVEHESRPWEKEEAPEAPEPDEYEVLPPVFEGTRQWDREEPSGTFRWLFERNPGRLVGERARAPCCKCNKCSDIDTAAQKYIPATFSDYDNIDPKELNELSEHQYMLCLSHMYGFILKDRTYDILDVGRLVDVKIVENAIDRLVMRPETNKETIKAIVKTYTDTGDAEHFNADFIQGKGEGQIFLLHGPPGTGKTFTAEAVAEYTRRPLLSITAADLGHEPMELEKNLLQFLKNASTWDAIVLLDEADVYLEQRSAHDLRRNSIVSIFLRAMEYFQGILFLTTNRVGHFDEAFMSRIHVSIGYEPLDDDARGKIWDNFFRKLKEDHKSGGPEILYEYDAKQYVKKDPTVKKLEWNGREIRNAFQTAVALAVFDSKTAREKGASEEDSIPEIKEKHLTQVVNMSAAFRQYIVATHEGVEDADRAYRMGIRHDRFGTGMSG